MIYRDESKYIVRPKPKTMLEMDSVLKSTWTDEISKLLSQPMVDLKPPIVDIHGKSLARTDGGMFVHIPYTASKS